MRRCADHPARLHETGFSLIELVMVMVIITIIAAMAVPRYASALQRYRADAAANRLAADLELARERARASSMPVTFEILDATRYRISGMIDLKDASSDYTVDLSEEPYLAVITPSVTTITFNGWGVPSTEAKFVLGVGTGQMSVLVAAETGEVTLP